MPSVAVNNQATSCRIGLGYDIHRTIPGKHVQLGGLQIAAPFSLEGHSDADVLLHAVTDAILGALAMEDIGHYFPPTDPANKGRASSEFLEFAVKSAHEKKYNVGNVDCNVICEEPKIGPHRQAIRESLAKLLKVDIGQVSVKGRTNERVDAVGRKEAVAVQAIVLLAVT